MFLLWKERVFRRIFHTVHIHAADGRLNPRKTCDFLSVTERGKGVPEAFRLAPRFPVLVFDISPLFQSESKTVGPFAVYLLEFVLH